MGEKPWQLPGTERPIGEADVDDMLAAIGAPGPTPTPELLLADALTHVCAPAPDLRRGILLAAIACESKIKLVLQERAHGALLALLATMLGSPRDFSMAAHSLFDSVAHSIVGRSLRKDDKKLYKQIQQLFTARNAFAHKAQQPSNSASILVFAASRAFEWMDSL